MISEMSYVILKKDMTKFSILGIAVILTSCTHPEKVTELKPAPSRVLSQTGLGGMVVADDEEAADWGVEILNRGGNAIDAAVATGFAMAVTRQQYASLGGGGFLVYCPRKQPCSTLDYRETAPRAATRDLFVKRAKPGQAPTELSQSGALASGVPGVTAGLLLALEKWGSRSRQEIFSRPIELAHRGYRFTGNSEIAAKENWETMSFEGRRIFGDGAKSDQPATPGTLIRQPELEKVLGEIKTHGRDGFYKGWVAKKIASGLLAAGGVMTEQDLADYRARLRPPMIGKYRGHEVISMGLPSSGGILLLQMLGYAERADVQGVFAHGFASVQTLHAEAHAMALSFADRSSGFGDSDFVKVPVGALLASTYLDERWKSFDSYKADLPEGPGPLPPGPLPKEHMNTTHFAVIDKNGNAVSITTTINDNFGSGFVPPGTGVVMNDEMDDFNIQTGLANGSGLISSDSNAIEPGKRPLSSMTPTIVRDSSGETRFVLGAQGGPRIITSVFQTLVNSLKFEMSLADAIYAPRIHEQWKPGDLLMEIWGFPEEVWSALNKMGYPITFVQNVGRIHAIERLPNGRVLGISDPRAEGAAVAQ